MVRDWLEDAAPKTKNGYFLIEHLLISESLKVPLFTMATTASLSHNTLTVMSFYKDPQTALATTIGANSFTVMWEEAMGLTYYSWNQFLPQCAPHPHEPDASDTNTFLGFSLLTTVITDTPFHKDAN